MAISVHDKDPSILEMKLNFALHKANDWLTHDKLTLNAKKTCFMIFGAPQSLKKFENVSVVLNDSVITREEKNLNILVLLLIQPCPSVNMLII